MITKQQMIDKLNALTDDPDQEIFALWDDCIWEIHDIGLEDDEHWSPSRDEFGRPVLLSTTKKICIDCS